MMAFYYMAHDHQLHACVGVTTPYFFVSNIRSTSQRPHLMQFLNLKTERQSVLSTETIDWLQPLKIENGRKTNERHFIENKIF
jgi:hypothetical protein